MSQPAGHELAIEVKGLSVSFRGTTALNAVDLEVRKGEVYGVVGTNGAGKSTLIDVLSGMVKPSAGSARVLGLDPIREAGELRRRIGVVSQEISLEEKLTAWENLQYFGRLLDVSQPDLEDRMQEMIRFMNLWGRRDDLVETYSVGMKKKVHFACSMVHSPEMILIDEATAGFDPITKRETEELIVKMNRDMGITVLLTTHDLAEARSLCDRIAVLHAGDIVGQGSWDQVASPYPAKLLIEGLSREARSKVEEVLETGLLERTAMGFEVAVSSQAEAFRLAGELQARGIESSSISYEVPLDSIFRDLTDGEDEDGA
jgi:ABC-type multidrug transport system ATPase subunit